MNEAGIYHRPESEFAFLYTKERMRIRLQTARNEIKSVGLIGGDFISLPKSNGTISSGQWRKIIRRIPMIFGRLKSRLPTIVWPTLFCITDYAGKQVFYTDQGLFSYDEDHLTQDNLYFRMPYFQEIDRFKVPSWVHQTVWYQIFPERFSNGDASNDPENALAWGSEKPTRENFLAVICKESSTSWITWRSWG